MVLLWGFLVLETCRNIDQMLSVCPGKGEGKIALYLWAVT